MKKKNIVLSLAGVLALVTGLSVNNAEGSEMCDNHRIIAENAMSHRLNGKSEENVDAMVESQISKVIVAMAYSYTLSSEKPNISEKVKQISDFGDYVTESCEGAVSRSKAKNKVDGIAI